MTKLNLDNPRRCSSTLLRAKRLEGDWVDYGGTVRHGPDMAATAGISLGATAGLLSSREKMNHSNLFVGAE
jgi:hypothetical protein